MVGGGGALPVPASPVKAAGVSRGSARARDDGRDGQVWARGRSARRRESQPLGAWASEDARRSPRRGEGGAAREQGAARRPCVRASGTLRFARGRSEVRAMEEEKYLPELMAEKDSLDPSFVHASRLLAEEIEKFQGSDGKKEDEEKKYLDVISNKNIKLSERVLIPVKQYPKGRAFHTPCYHNERTLKSPFTEKGYFTFTFKWKTENYFKRIIKMQVPFEMCPNLYPNSRVP
uniref:KHDRBS Qua1 domain-containing protein n=1 Tax=Felis catus TaxID=9685 RepID=A0ABI7X326_FELCA